MPDTVAVLICTYGERMVWNRFAARALSSVAQQTRPPDEVIRVHDATLALARNRAAEMARTDYLIFLDADDEIETRYVDSMMNADGRMRYPMVQRCIEEGYLEPVQEYPKRPILDGNYMVIGTMMRREDLLTVGGFREMKAYEDWDLFCRLVIQRKIQPELCRDAIYRVHVRKNSRNHLTTEESARLVKEIRTRYTREGIGALQGI